MINILNNLGASRILEEDKPFEDDLNSFKKVELL